MYMNMYCMWCMSDLRWEGEEFCVQSCLQLHPLNHFLVAIVYVLHQYLHVCA